MDYNRFIECVDPDYTHDKDRRVANTTGGVAFDALADAEVGSIKLADVLGQVQLRVSKRKIHHLHRELSHPDNYMLHFMVFRKHSHEK